MNIAIVDDQKLWRQELSGRVSKCCRKPGIIKCFANGDSFGKDTTVFDIVFMDVELENEDGFRLGYEYKAKYPQGILIFVTTHTELSRMGYHVDAFRYISKNHLDELPEAVKSAENRLIQNEMIELHVVGSENVRVLCKDILYVETIRRNIEVHTKRGNYTCVGNITDLAEEWLTYGFYYVHRSYLVNVEEVESFNRRSITLKNKQEIDVSARRYADFKKFFFTWKFR